MEPFGVIILVTVLDVRALSFLSRSDPAYMADSSLGQEVAAS